MPRNTSRCNQCGCETGTSANCLHCVAFRDKLVLAARGLSPSDGSVPDMMVLCAKCGVGFYPKRRSQVNVAIDTCGLCRERAIRKRTTYQPPRHKRLVGK